MKQLLKTAGAPLEKFLESLTVVTPPPPLPILYTLRLILLNSHNAVVVNMI